MYLGKRDTQNIYEATFCQTKNLVAIKKLKKTQNTIPRELKFIANNAPPSFAMFRIVEAITLNGKLLAIG